MHELEFYTEVIEPLVDVFREFYPEGLVEPCDIAHHMGLGKNVVISK